VQEQVDRTDQSKGQSDKPKGAMQAGARSYPEPPFPRQHQTKPGDEAALDPLPMYDAPFYRGSRKLDGKIALITGGDSGIGRAVSVLFARERAHVAISYLAETKDAEVTKDAVEKEGGKCLLLPGDVSDTDHCRMIVEQVIKTFGGLDILVNNAAFQYHAGSIEELTPEHFDLTLKTNLYGYFNMTREAVPYMRQGSAIINTGSVTGIDGSKELIDYSMTKGGIHAFTRALASNLIPRGIRVNAVAPGPVWTPLNPSEKSAEDVAEFGARTPMKRPAQPEEIAPAYVFFASSHCSSYITGEILPIIGGY
jgi:NAD(P)-dependent dehydrogenase (short-subunit alcohol dehydrogenase family)